MPPNWEPSGPGRFPILFNGFYDVNENTFKQEGPFIVRQVAQSSQQGGRGAIGIIWNGGGAMAGRSTSRRAFDQFASVIDFASSLGGSPDEIVTFGASRGGWTSLAMASNPYGHRYRVVAACADVPGTRIGTHIALTSATYPGLISAVAWTTGFRNAWQSGWTYPLDVGPLELRGLSGPEAHAKILFEGSDLALIDRELSLSSESFLSGLQQAGTSVYLGAGEHDDICPFALQIEYAALLRNRGIPLRLDVNVRLGHGSLWRAGLPAIQFWAKHALEQLLGQRPSSTGSSPRTFAGAFFHRVNRSTGDVESFTPPRLPFSMDAPYVVARKQRVPIVLTGEPGTEYRVWIRRLSSNGLVGGELITSFEGTIPGSDQTRGLLAIAYPGQRICWDAVWIDIPSTLPPGKYFYPLAIRTPGVMPNGNEANQSTCESTSEAHWNCVNAPGWKGICSKNTPSGTLATVLVLESEPDIDADAAFSGGKSPKQPRYAGTNWGQSEY